MEEKDRNFETSETDSKTSVDPARVDRWIDNALSGIQDIPLDPESGISREQVLNGARVIAGHLEDYKDLMMREECAIREVRTKLEVLNTEYSVKSLRNPISRITSRLKSTSSIIQKMIRYGAEFSIDGIENSLNDIAGIRVVCEYIDDIYTIADALLSQTDITLIRKKDYIENPKPNGYRSLHLIISVPVFFSNQTKNMKVEVQIRTIAMDFWASLEHQLKYKQHIKDQERIVKELKDCAETISGIDKKMLGLRNEISKGPDLESEEKALMDELNQFDFSFE